MGAGWGAHNDPRVGQHLQEHARVLLVDGDQLDVSDGVDEAHGQAGHGHGDGQQRDITAQGDDGEHHGDDHGRDEQGRQGTEQPSEKQRQKKSCFCVSKREWTGYFYELVNSMYNRVVR